MSDIENKDQNINELESSEVSQDVTTKEDACTACTCQTNNSDGEVEDALSQAKDKKPNPYLESFLKEMEKLPNAESKIKYALEFMETSLAQAGTPHFKSFWEVRNICLELFKENMAPAVRSEFWLKYSDLSKEARRLKDLLDEQSSFAAEQIEIAITALENEITSFEEQVKKFADPFVEQIPQAIIKKKDFYTTIQKKLNLLNVQASRVNALRKELIKTEMRVRLKNKFFQRLSLVGDQIFPLRKDLIKELSQEFSKDVDGFVNNHFDSDFSNSLFNLREDIKGLQGIAKILTLNTQSFTHTRLLLSECWDKIKSADKERKKERAQLKVVFKENADIVLKKIEELNAKIEADELSPDLAKAEIDAILKFMRTVELGRDEIKSLKDHLAEIQKPLNEKIQAKELEKVKVEQEKERQRKEKIDALKSDIENISQNLNSYSVNELKALRDDITEKVQNVLLSKYEKQEIERQIKSIKTNIADILSEKEEEALLSLSDDDRQSITQLREVLKQRKERRQEIKLQLETLRKIAGGSGFDFEKAMQTNELINVEKERLEKINLGIKEIEDKIAELQKKK